MREHIGITRLMWKCPRLIWKYMHEEAEETLPSEEGERGISDHELLERFLKGADKEWLEKYGNPASLIKLQQQSEDIGIEEWITIDITDPPVVGRLDIRFTTKDKVHIIDLKTSPNAIPDEKVRWQTKCYALPFIDIGREVETWMYKPKYDDLIHLDTLTPIDSIPIKRYIQRKVKMFIEIAEGEEPKANGGADCDYCPYAISCKHNVFKAIEEDPVGYIAEWLKREAQTKQMTKIVKTYMKKIPHLLEVNGKEVGWETGYETEYDREGIVKFMVEHTYEGIKSEKEKVAQFIIEKILPIWGNPSADAMNTMAKSVEEITAFIHKKPVPKWRNRKIKKAKEE